MAADGLDDTIRALDGIVKKIRGKALKKAVSAGTQAILKAARSNVIRRTGLLKKSLGRKIKVYRGSGTVFGVVGARRKFRVAIGVRVRGKRRGETIYADPSKYLHLVERGTKRSRAQAFLGPAESSTRATVRSAMVAIIQQVIIDAAAGGGT